MNALRLGFIGVGTMGAPLAERLLKAGHSLTVCDVNAKAASALERQGAEVAPTPAQVASVAEIVFACLPTSDVSREVALGNGGVAYGTSMQIYVETSTSGVATIQAIANALADRGVDMLDAPVSGGAVGARTGRLTCMLSGAPNVLEHARPAIDAIADRLFYVGEQPGMAQLVKIANQLINTTNFTVACEALSMTTKAGLDPTLVLNVINASSGRNSSTESVVPEQVVAEGYRGGCRLDILHKDITLAVAEAERLKTASFVGSAVRQIWAYASNRDGDQDFTNLYRYFEEWATPSKANAGLPDKKARRRR